MLSRTLICAAGIALLASACAQNLPPATPQPAGACPADSDMSDTQLLGQWSGSIQGQPGSVRIELGPHPEWKGTAKGHVLRGDARLPMVGDVDNGSVTLEESADGVHITGTWLGQVVDGSCGREIRGDYLPGEEARPQPFVLRKLAPALYSSPAPATAPIRH